MISILDPTGFLGRGFAAALAERVPELRLRYFHTSAEEEHLIAEVSGEASIVARLSDLDELEGSGAVVVTEVPTEDLALELLSWLRDHQEVALVDLSQPGIAGELAVTVLGSPPRVDPTPRWFHLADPCLLAPAITLEALSPLDPSATVIVATRPASTFGEKAIHEMAAQAAARLSGTAPKRPVLLPGVVAFDVAPVGAEERFALETQLRALLPGVDTVFQLLDVGTFHGHTATVVVQCRRAVTERDVRTLLRTAPGLELARANTWLHLGDVTRLDKVLYGDVRVDGGSVALWLAADGLRLAAAELAPSLVAALRLDPS